MIIIYFFEGVKEKGAFWLVEKSAPKSLYFFVSDSSDSAEMYSVELHSMELHSADSTVPKGKLNFFLKIRSTVLNIAFLSFVRRLGIFLFLY